LPPASATASRLLLADQSQIVTTEQPPVARNLLFVMMGFAGPLINGCPARKFNRHEPFIVQRRFKVSIDCGDSQACGLGLCRFQHLLRRKRPVGSLEDVTDRWSCCRAHRSSNGFSSSAALTPGKGL